MKTASPQVSFAVEQQVGWDDLRILLAVVQDTSIRGAAVRLGLNASTVSRRVAALEAALGTKLFERHPTGLFLTSAGEEATRFGAQLEEELRELRLRLAQHETELSGLLRITSAEILAMTSARLVGEFVREHPKISVDLRVSDAMVSVEKHEVDIAIRVADEPGETLVGRRVGRVAVGLFASKDYVRERGRKLSSLEHRFVEWPRGVEHKPAFRWLDRQYPERTASVRASSASAVLTCVRAGMGIAPLGLSQGSAESDLVLLQRLPEECSTAVWLLTHRDMRATARVRAALDFLGEALAVELVG